MTFEIPNFNEIWVKILSLLFSQSSYVGHIEHLSILEIVLILIFFKIRQWFMHSLVGVFLFYFPGVFLHEMAHFIVALILKAKPKMMRLYPQRKEDGSIDLGHVTVRNLRWYNQFLIGMAPLSLFGLVWLLQHYYFSFFQSNIVSSVIYFYLIVVLVDSAIPSIVDIKHATSSKIGLLLWIGVISGMILVISKGHRT